MSYQPYDVIEAKFQPRRADNLQNNAAEFVGWRGRWSALWEITEEDGGPYVGQWAWQPDGLENAWFGWAPTEDLADLVGPPSSCDDDHPPP